MLACGGDDQKVNLLVQESDRFVTVQKLSGHEDWVRSLAFTHTGMFMFIYNIFLYLSIYYILIALLLIKGKPT